MSSPVGHGLAALPLALAYRHLIPQVSRRRLLVVGAALAAAATAPDLDFVPGILVGDPNRFHHGVTHSLACTALFGLVAWGCAWVAGVRPAHRTALLFGLAYASHLVLDLLTIDRRPSYGMPLFWPVSDMPVTLPFKLFLDIQRDPGRPTFLPSLLVLHNAYAVAWEVVVMSAVFGACGIGRRVRRGVLSVRSGNSGR